MKYESLIDSFYQKHLLSKDEKTNFIISSLLLLLFFSFLDFKLLNL